MLMASTYPLQVIAAARWREKDDNERPKGEALVKALQQQNWDPGVKSLVPFPQAVAAMNESSELTQQLGYAVANRQAAVLDSIQQLRRSAQKAGSLKTTERQRVIFEEETVIIEPADPGTIYVPLYAAYDPAAYAPGYLWGTGLAFAAGAAVVARLWGLGEARLGPR